MTIKGGNKMKRELDGKQFTCVELSFIRFCMDRIIWSMMPNEIYHDGEIVLNMLSQAK